jgi:hypothetical protein
MTDDESFTDILQDRTHKYRRTLIAVCLIIVGTYWLPIRFDDLNLFGMRPEEGYAYTRLVILVTLWSVWLYHAWLFAHYARRDWRDWRSVLRYGDVESKREAFPEIPMYFPRWWWGHPGEDLRSKHDCTSWDYSEGVMAVWTCKRPNADPMNFKIKADNAQSVRSRVWWFFVVDCGLPIFLSLLALAAAGSRHLP